MTDLNPKGLEAAFRAVSGVMMEDQFGYKAHGPTVISLAICAYIAASPTPPVEAEPVAWHVRNKGGSTWMLCNIPEMVDQLRADGATVIALCPEPPTVPALQARVRELEGALHRQKANIEHWLDTGEAAGPEESRSIYDQICAALVSHNPPEMRHNALSVQQDGSKP
jgi:hypothetical protein